jgi:multiple sugar transport system ATP-binding protein
MASVVLENVWRIFSGSDRQEKVAVENFNLRIEDREFMVFVGPSGCGKTTTLRMIAGLEDISRGTIRIADKVINDTPPKDRDIAMVFQNYALYPHMTVLQNMAFGLKLRKTPKSEINKRVNDAAQILGLLEPDNLLNRKPKALSGGQRQRVALGRAIVRQPKAFLFDEPLSNLDAKMRVEMRTEISKLHNRLNATMIYVTHDQTEAMTMADRIVVMNRGQIQQIAEPLTIYQHPANLFVASFIGSPPMNFLHGTIVTREGALWFEGSHDPSTPVPMRLHLDDEHAKHLRAYQDKKVVLGLRPEHLEDSLYALGADPRRTFQATIDVIEPMGPETILYVNSGQHSLIVRSQQNRPRAAVSERIGLVADMINARFFDPTTTNAIA